LGFISESLVYAVKRAAAHSAHHIMHPRETHQDTTSRSQACTRNHSNARPPHPVSSLSAPCCLEPVRTLLSRACPHPAVSSLSAPCCLDRVCTLLSRACPHPSVSTVSAPCCLFVSLRPVPPPSRLHRCPLSPTLKCLTIDFEAIRFQLFKTGTRVQGGARDKHYETWAADWPPASVWLAQRVTRI
jgi:hypothetical protein